MIKKLIEKLKITKNTLSEVKLDDNINKNNISNIFFISKENEYIVMEINDYISLMEYTDLIKNDLDIDSLLSICVLWNSGKQKVNKGKYFITSTKNNIYNILINEEKIIIDEKVIKEERIEERIINFNLNDNNYAFTIFYHDKVTGSTFYNKYYGLDIELGELTLSIDEATKEINYLFNSLPICMQFDNIKTIEKEILENLKTDKEKLLIIKSK